MEIQNTNSSELLFSEFQKIKSRNKAYSLRAFAKKIDVPAGRLSQYFSGKRAISENVAKKIVDKMGFSPEYEKQFMSAIRGEGVLKNHAMLAEISDNEYTQLSADAFAVLSEWYYFAILNLIKVKGFKSDPEWIANRIGLNKKTVTQAIARLKRLGLIEAKGTTFTRVHKQIRTSDGLESRALRISHEQSLNQAIESLHTVDVQLRDITSVTMAIDIKRIPQAKKLIKEFRRKLSIYLEAGEQDEVYNLNVQLVPLTKISQ